MTIDEIYKNEDLSVRSYNVCRRNGIDSIVKLQQYYAIYQTFEGLQNCGRRSNEELIDICLKYQDCTVGSDDMPRKHKNYFEEILTNLTRIQRDVINSFIQVNTNSLSVRSKNAISIYLKNNFSVRNFATKILLNKYFSVAEIENIGMKSIPELEIYISIVKDFIKEVVESSDEKQLFTLKNNFLIQRTFYISKIPQEILQSESIFGLVSFLLKSNCLFSERDTQILIDTLFIFSNKGERDLGIEAKKYNLTRQRVESIRKDGLNTLFVKLSFIKNFNDDLFQNYGIDISSSLIEVNENLVNQINTLNKTKFSKVFISYILAVFLSENFLVIGNIEDILQPKYFNSRNRHNWNNFYIVNKKLSNVDFLMLADDIAERLNERIEETYYFNFKSYLSKFINNLDSEIIELVFPVAEKIINDEFELYLDLNDNLVFKRNTVKQVAEYAIEALETLGVPSKIEEIYKLIEVDNPEITKSQEALRGSLQRTPEIIYFGRSSTYGLKKWEIEKEGIRGGTIKDIIFEYLQDKNDPIHILELLSEVHNYREKTNAKNIITNLKLDPQNQFIIFNQSFVGLRSKTYNSNLISLPKFLGKTITYYVNQQKNTNRITVEEYFSTHLKISQRNMKYIIDYLIEQQFVFIDNKNNLSI